jgi:uncharacterized protein (TIGR00661 family)
MRILYGVVGEGMGHATRSRVVVEHLLTEGHEVVLMASQRAVAFLRQYFPDVRSIHGMHIITEENRVRRGKTLFRNVEEGLGALPAQIRSYFQLVESFEPQCVVSDFESFTYLFGKAHRLPVLCVDNNHFLHRCEHPPEVRDVDRAAFELAKAFVKGKMPGCDHYLITTFVTPKVRKARTTLYPPILRQRILDAASSEGEHLLVYQTAEGKRELALALAGLGIECRVYGMRRELTEEVREGNLRYRPFSDETFVEDLASARGVVTGGGFSLMSECVYLHKPVLSTPIRGQFEQTLNALYLERAGYGMYAKQVDASVLGELLERLPTFRKNLRGYHQDGNRALLEGLDEKLDAAAAGVL